MKLVICLSCLLVGLDRKHEGLGAIDDEDEDGAESAEQQAATDHTIDDETSGIHGNEASDSEGFVDSNSSVDPIGKDCQSFPVVSY